MSSSTVAVPRVVKFSMPFGSRCHPDVEAARQRNLEWTRKVGLVVNDADAQRILVWDMAGIMAYWLPRASKEGLDLAIDVITVASFLEDHLEDSIDKPVDFVRDACASMLAVLDTGQAPEPRAVLPVAFAGLWKRLCQGTSPEWIRRNRLHWRGFIEACVEEARVRGERVSQTLDSFLALRRASGFAHVMVDMSEWSNGIALPDRVRDIPSVDRIVTLTVDLLDTMNDVHSLEKELVLGDVHNLLLILQRERGLTREVATEATCDLMQGWCDEIARLEAQLPQDCVQHQLSPRETEDALHFVRALKEGIGGHPDWYRTCARYDDQANPRATSVGTSNPMRRVATLSA